MSSPFHPQTDGQTERVNQILECYLRNYCNYEQDHWSEILPMADYTHNNSLTTTTGISLFIANFGFNPQTNWPIKAEAKNPASRNCIHWMTSVHTLCRNGLDQGWETMGKYHDRHAKEPPKHSVGNLGMLRTSKLKDHRGN
jgi:hypothetical protein